MRGLSRLPQVMECGRLRGPYSSAQTSQIQPGLRESIVVLGKGRKGKGGAAESLSLSQKKGRRKNWDLFAKKKNFGFDPVNKDDQGIRFRKVDVSCSRSLKTLFFFIIHRDFITRAAAISQQPSRTEENGGEHRRTFPKSSPSSQRSSSNGWSPDCGTELDPLSISGGVSIIGCTRTAIRVVGNFGFPHDQRAQGAVSSSSPTIIGIIPSPHLAPSKVVLEAR